MKEEKPLTYRERVQSLADAMTKNSAEAIPADVIDTLHQPPQQFQAFAILAYTPDTGGTDINFQMSSQAACLPEFSAFILAQGVARGLAHIAQQTSGGDGMTMVKNHDMLRNAFMGHLMQLFGFSGLPQAGSPAEGEA